MSLNLFILDIYGRLIVCSHHMGRHDSGGPGRSGNKSGQSSKSFEGQFKKKKTPDNLHRLLFNFCFSFVTFLLEDGKKSLPIIPGISTTPGTMIYAGSIGTQIANEMLDFNRYEFTA